MLGTLRALKLIGEDQLVKEVGGSSHYMFPKVFKKRMKSHEARVRFM